MVNIISSSELGGQPYLAPYVAAKAGLAGLTRNSAHALRWDRIRINGLDIGWTRTEGEDATQRAIHGAGDDWLERAAGHCRWETQPGRGDSRLRGVPVVRAQRGRHRFDHRLGPERPRLPGLTDVDAARPDQGQVTQSCESV
jgi:NAD(P)-dependent dehydrogenase (short-subunit alcohol dehydrogenase family)